MHESVLTKFSKTDFSNMTNIKSLAQQTAALTADKREQLQLLLLWTAQYMAADSVRFFHGGNPYTATEALQQGKGLCDEYAMIFQDFCHALGIPAIRIEGYVRELGFQPNDPFHIGNHVWNAVQIDSSWLLCDLFWSTTTLHPSVQGNAIFRKTLNTSYYLSAPKDFIATHLPLTPVFQFDNHPIRLEAFNALLEGVDETIVRMPFCDYPDSISKWMNLSESERNVCIAENAYAYNPENTNVLIAAYYNGAVEVLNKPSAGRKVLLKAQSHLKAALKLLDASTDEHIKSLTAPCERGLQVINDRLKK